MKYLLAIAVLSFVSFSCKKDAKSEKVYTGTVVVISSPGSNYSVVELDNPDHKEQSFICNDGNPLPPAGHFNCRNAIFVTNLAAAFNIAGTRISFRGYKDLGRNLLWSSTLAPNDVELYNVTKLP